MAQRSLGWQDNYGDNQGDTGLSNSPLDSEDEGPVIPVRVDLLNHDK
jgi:hypothetical protein